MFGKKMIAMAFAGAACAFAFEDCCSGAQCGSDMSFATTAPAPSTACEMDDGMCFAPPTNSTRADCCETQCDAGMCFPNDTCTPASNTTSAVDMMSAAPGTCAPPAQQSAEEMFNSDNTCGDGFAGAMCGLQQNITSFFGGNSTDSGVSSKKAEADDTLDSCDSDLQDSL